MSPLVMKRPEPAGTLPTPTFPGSRAFGSGSAVPPAQREDCLPPALKRALVTVIAVFGLVAGTAGAAAATTSYVGGGTWWHGVTSVIVYSNYHHPNRCHGSTAVGETTASAMAGAGRISR